MSNPAAALGGAYVVLGSFLALVTLADSVLIL